MLRVGGAQDASLKALKATDTTKKMPETLAGVFHGEVPRIAMTPTMELSRERKS